MYRVRIPEQLGASPLSAQLEQAGQPSPAQSIVTTGSLRPISLITGSGVTNSDPSQALTSRY